MKGIEDSKMRHATLEEVGLGMLPQSQNTPSKHKPSKPMVAYLVNVYPKVSHSFIRREIAALEAQGLQVVRFSIRRSTELVDSADRAEAEATTVVLDDGLVGLVRAVVTTFFKDPSAWWRTLRLARHIGWGSDSGLLKHFIYFAEACGLAQTLLRLNVAHLHAHFGTNPADVAMYVNALTNLPYSFTVHGPEEFDRPISLRLAEKIRRARFVVAISSFGRSQLLRWVDYSEWPKIQVIRCGLDAQFLDAPLADVPRTPRLVCVGRLCEQKGQLLLLQAAAQLAQEGRKFELILVGDGELRETIEQQIINSHLENYVTITGWQSNEQVCAWLQSSRALVLPSFAEGLPVVIMEALAMGRPVISTYIAGIPELLTPECGWIIPAGAIDALVKTMAEVLDSSTSTLTTMGRVGREQVRQCHNANTEAGKLAQLVYREESQGVKN
jgi:glycosyltransferase involved in cell wall biosynthesis